MFCNEILSQTVLEVFGLYRTVRRCGSWTPLHILYTALIQSAEKLLYSPAEGYLCYFEVVHSSTQTKVDKKQDIYLKYVILAL